MELHQILWFVFAFVLVMGLFMNETYNIQETKKHDDFMSQVNDRYILRKINNSNVPRILADKLEIEADGGDSAEDFVKHVLAEILTDLNKGDTK